VGSQAGLAWWSTVSPYGGFGSTAALVFVLLVAGIKAVYEDYKRHSEDNETNKTMTHVMQADGEGLSWQNGRQSKASALRVFEDCTRHAEEQPVSTQP